MKIEANESKKRTPVDTGALRESTRVTEPVIENGKMRVDILVGGEEAPYAIYVHEDLEAFHKVGQAKFLESTLMESRPYMAERIAARMNKK